MSRIGVATALAASLLLSSCAATGPAPVERALGSARERLSLDAAVERARTDAAGRLGLPASAIETVSAESVTWPDGGLGCPQPGVVYTMALVPGYRVRLRVQGGELSYHASERGAIVLCPPGRGTAPAPGGDTRR